MSPKPEETEFDKFMLDSTAKIAGNVSAFEKKMSLPPTPASRMNQIVLVVANELLNANSFDTNPTAMMFRMTEQTSKTTVLIYEMLRLKREAGSASFTPEFLARSRDVTRRHAAANGPPDAKKSVSRVLDEVHELTLAGTDGHKAEEACDVMLTCVALLHNLGLSDVEIGRLLSETLSKAERKAPGEAG